MTDLMSNDEMFKIHYMFKSFTNCEIIFIDMSKYDSLINETNVDNRFTKYTLYRLLIPKVINEKKVLYIDSDTLVISSLKYLYDLDPKSVIGVIDKNIEKYADKALRLNYTKYVNAGVLLMNLDYLRGISDKWIEMCNKRKYPCHDQDIINLTCKPQLIGNEWNSSISTGLAAINNINIMHWAGKNPWDKKDVVLSFLWRMAENRFNNWVNGTKFIPKLIHLCWFGDNTKSQLVNKCYQSIAKCCFDYDIIEYNQNNFDITVNTFVKQAYANQKFAFITDYVRLWCLNKFGGIYMDSDVEVLKPLDAFLDNIIFTGKETDNLWATAVMGCITEYTELQALVNYYNKKRFTKKEKANTKLLSDFFKKSKEAKIYNIDVFCPYNHKDRVATPTENTYTIHHFNGSWTNREPISNVVLPDKQITNYEFLNYYHKNDWSMENYERMGICYLLQNMITKNNALIIGSCNGLLNLLSSQFKQVVTINPSFENLDKTLFDNVKFIENTCNPTALLNILKLADLEPFDLLVIDADHDYKFIYNHLTVLTTYKPKNDLFILVHDTWYLPTRLGFNDVNWNYSKYIHFIDMDFTPGVKIKGNKFVGGLGFIIMRPIERTNDITMKQMKYHYKVATK
jgi:hypothetical protein